MAGGGGRGKENGQTRLRPRARGTSTPVTSENFPCGPEFGVRGVAGRDPVSWDICSRFRHPTLYLARNSSVPALLEPAVVPWWLPEQALSTNPSGELNCWSRKGEPPRAQQPTCAHPRQEVLGPAHPDLYFDTVCLRLAFQLPFNQNKSVVWLPKIQPKDTN